MNLKFKLFFVLKSLMLRKYKILVALQNVNTTDRYTFVIVDIAKDPDTNIIFKVAVGKNGIKSNILYDDLRKYTMAYLHHGQIKIDYAISNIKGYLQDFYYYDTYSNKDEHNLILNYINYYEKITNLATPLQNISSGHGVFLVDTDSSPTRWKIDNSSIQMPTLAIMFAMDLVIKNKFHSMLEAIERIR